MAEAGDEIGLMWCCNFPNFIYTKKSDSKKKLYALFKNNSYRHYKGIQLPNAAGLSGSKNVGSLVGTHSSLVRLKTTSLNSISLVMNGFHLWPNISYYPTPAASGSSILFCLGQGVLTQVAKDAHGTGRSVSSQNGSQRNGFHGEVLHTIGD